MSYKLPAGLCCKYTWATMLLSLQLILHLLQPSKTRQALSNWKGIDILQQSIQQGEVQQLSQSVVTYLGDVSEFLFPDASHLSDILTLLETYSG